MFVWTGHFMHTPDDYVHRNSIKLTPVPSDRFKLVTSLNRELKDAVSFEYSKKEGWYVTCKDRTCFIAPKRKTRNFERQSSFFPLLNLWYDGYTVFESTTKAGWYLRFHHRGLVLAQYDGTELFKQEASFQNRKIRGRDVSPPFHEDPTSSNDCLESCPTAATTVSPQRKVPRPPNEEENNHSRHFSNVSFESHSMCSIKSDENGVSEASRKYVT